jgi:hypothetical protein
MLQIRIDMPAVHARIPLDVADNWCPQYDNRPKFLRREIAEKPDVARAGEKMYYLSAGFLIFRQSSSSRD